MVERRLRPNIFTNVRTKLVLVSALAALLLACGSDEVPVSGVIEARRLTIAAETGGRAIEVAVREGQRVAAGDVLVRIHCAIPEAQRDQARAAILGADAVLAQADAQQQLVADGARPQEREAATADVTAAQQALRMARRGATSEQIDQLQAALDGVGARIDLAETSLARAETLSEAGSSPVALRDAAAAELAVLTAEQSRLQAALAEASSGARSEEVAILRQRVVQAEARLSAMNEGAREPERDAVQAARGAADAQRLGALAALAAAEEQVARCVVRSPVAGVADVVAIDEGELVGPGTPLVALAPDGTLTVRTWIPQQRLGDTQIGTSFLVVPDGRDSSAGFRGTVRRIEDEAEFTSGNVQTPDDRTLLVYRMDLDIAADTPGLRPGMTVVVDLASAEAAEGSR